MINSELTQAVEGEWFSLKRRFQDPVVALHLGREMEPIIINIFQDELGLLQVRPELMDYLNLQPEVPFYDFPIDDDIMTPGRILLLDRTFNEYVTQHKRDEGAFLVNAETSRRPPDTFMIITTQSMIQNSEFEINMSFGDITMPLSIARCGAGGASVRWRDESKSRIRLLMKALSSDQYSRYVCAERLNTMPYLYGLLDQSGWFRKRIIPEEFTVSSSRLATDEEMQTWFKLLNSISRTYYQSDIHHVSSRVIYNKYPYPIFIQEFSHNTKISIPIRFMNTTSNTFAGWKLAEIYTSQSEKSEEEMVFIKPHYQDMNLYFFRNYET